MESTSTMTKRVFKDNCQVCQVTVSKYKCAKCRVLYCSIDCQKGHECKDELIQNENRKERTEGNQDEVFDDEYRVPRRLLERIRDSDNLRSKLKSERLQELIKSIDGSDSKLKMLNHEMQYNKDFHDFIYEMLQEIGYVDANGQFTG